MESFEVAKFYVSGRKVHLHSKPDNMLTNILKLKIYKLKYLKLEIQRYIFIEIQRYISKPDNMSTNTLKLTFINWKIYNLTVQETSVLKLNTWDTDNWEKLYQQLHCDLSIKSDGNSIRNSLFVLYFDFQYFSWFDLLLY